VNLIKAWKLLENQNINPVLYLTLNESVFTDLINELSVSKSLKIINLGLISRDLLLDFYNKCDCMVFPSRYESFGLPLIEATRFKLPIVAPELDYVREVCCPVETFDPLSPVSLSDSVKRFLGIKRSRLAIKDHEDFLICLLKG
jgi:glycosyltransferase involved in cell wall biosynthesis